MGSCAFDKLFTKSVPHILEKIFFSLDYESYKESLKVSDTWNKLLLSESYLKIGKTVFRDEISKDQEKLNNAANNGNTTEVKKLLSSGMLDVNREHGFILDTPLLKAAGNRVMIQLLLDRGANPNKSQKYGVTPLHKAAHHGHKAVIKLLLDKGADPNGSDQDGWTALHWATYCDHKDVVKLLLERGADPNKAHVYGTTPLHKAARYGHKSVFQLLLDGGADINSPAINGRTPLHSAAVSGCKGMVQFLLEKGAMPDKTDVNGRTPLSVAHECGLTDVAKILTNHTKTK